MADTDRDNLRQKCETFAMKYGFKQSDLEKGLEAYAAHVFAQGADSSLTHKWWDGTRWNPWESLGGVMSSGPDAGSTQVLAAFY